MWGVPESAGGGWVNYDEFLATKAQLANAGGFEPTDCRGTCSTSSGVLVEWAVRQGRGAIFADCGMGKTPMALAWADQVPQAHR